MGAIALGCAMCSVLFLIGVSALVWLCRMARESGSGFEGGIEVRSWAFWLRWTPKDREGSPRSGPSQRKAAREAHGAANESPDVCSDEGEAGAKHMHRNRRGQQPATRHDDLTDL